MIEVVLERLEGVRRTSNGWMARCPAHDDRRASLSVAEGDDGTLLMTCFAGCTFSEIVAALGMREQDAFGDNKLRKMERRIKRLERKQAEYDERLRKLERLRASNVHLRYHRNLTASTRELWYREGVYDEAIEMFLLGYAAECPTYHESPSRTIPIFGHDNELVNIRHRLLTPGDRGKYRPQMSGLGTALFNASVLNTSHERLLILEGEVKTIVLSQAGYIAVGVMGQNAKWQPEWLGWLDVGQIIVCFDPGTEERARELGRGFVERGFRDTGVAEFPLKPDDMIVRAGAGAKDIDAILQLARPVGRSAGGG